MTDEKPKSDSITVNKKSLIQAIIIGLVIVALLMWGVMATLAVSNETDKTNELAGQLTKCQNDLKKLEKPVETPKATSGNKKSAPKPAAKPVEVKKETSQPQQQVQQNPTTYQAPVNMQMETPVIHQDSGTKAPPPRSTNCASTGCIGDAVTNTTVQASHVPTTAVAPPPPSNANTTTPSTGNTSAYTDWN
jgi:outer membrane biosynthesis protein TonB